MGDLLRCILVSYLIINSALGYSIEKETSTLSDQIVEESTPVASLNELRLQNDVVTEQEGSVVVTEGDLSFADDHQPTIPPPSFDMINEEENEILLEKRDVEAVTDKVVREYASPETTPHQESTTGDDFPEFVRPTTPDPNAEYVETDPSAGVNMTELTQVLLAEGVNITGEFVRGRSDCKCGVPGRRIVGGSVASIKDYPWTVGLTRGGRPYCGGSLINSHFVATASHCVDGQSANRIIVVLGEQDYNSNSDGAYPQRIGVSQIIMHQYYNGKNIDNDIALLRLSQPVQLGGQNIPVCLPASNNNDFTNEQATVAGWGATSQGGSTSSTLRQVMVKVLSNDECNSSRSKYSGKITQNMLCAGDFHRGGKDSCQGDSGGPLIIENGGRRTLIGIVSWGYGCAQAYAPGVYTRVGRYPDWILSNTRGANWCQG